MRNLRALPHCPKIVTRVGRRRFLSKFYFQASHIYIKRPSDIHQKPGIFEWCHAVRNKSHASLSKRSQQCLYGRVLQFYGRWVMMTKKWATMTAWCQSHDRTTPFYTPIALPKRISVLSCYVRFCAGAVRWLSWTAVPILHELCAGFFNTPKQDRQKPIYVVPWAMIPWAQLLSRLLSQS